MATADYYVTTDAMGSVMAVLDEAGNVLERRSYDAFGQVTYMLPDGTVVADSPTGVDIGFQGQQIDELTGMYQMGYRWYSPVLGRWVSSDPIGLEGGTNFYSSYDNNPICATDPSGMLSIFMDGTGNDEISRGPDDSITNIFRLFKSSTDSDTFYIKGVGTNSCDCDRLSALSQGLGPDGMVSRINEAMGKIAAFSQTHDMCKEPIFLFGFSRGAAEVRDLANKILQRYPCAKIKFMGLFDTVSCYGLPNTDEGPLDLRIDPRVESIMHIVAADESRPEFTPTLIRTGPGRIGLWLPGSHSDIGGGYSDDSAWYAGRALIAMALAAESSGARISLGNVALQVANMEFDPVYHAPYGVIIGRLKDADRISGFPKSTPSRRYTQEARAPTE